MKTIATLIFVLLTGFSAQAKDHGTDSFDTVVVPEVRVVQAEEQNELARLYRFKGSLVKKELSFATKNNKSKVA